MTRYRQPEPPKRGAWHLVAAIFLWTVLAALIVGAAAGGAAYLKGHQFVSAISPKTKSDIAAAKRLDLADPSQPTIALVIGTDRRKGFQAELTGPLGHAHPRPRRSGQPVAVAAVVPARPDRHRQVPGPSRRARTHQLRLLGVRRGRQHRDGRALTGLPINYFVTVNFRGFMDLVNNLGGVWIDVDHRYLCDPTNCPGVSKINLWPGYQRVERDERARVRALPPLRLRHLPQRTPAAVPQGAEAADLVAARDRHRSVDRQCDREERRRRPRRQQGARREDAEATTSSSRTGFRPGMSSSRASKGLSGYAELSTAP